MMKIVNKNVLKLSSFKKMLVDITYIKIKILNILNVILNDYEN